jgi:hypothetical protein
MLNSLISEFWALYLHFILAQYCARQALQIKCETKFASKLSAKITIYFIVSKPCIH